MGCVQSKTEDTTVKTTTNPPVVENGEENAVGSAVIPSEAEPVAEDEPNVEDAAAGSTSSAGRSTVHPEAEENPEADKSTSKEPVNESVNESVIEVYKIEDHEVDEAGVVFYTVETVKGDVSFKKRFSEFKALVSELGSPKSLPSLPSSGLGAKLRGKHNPDLIKERETQLALVLNGIANDVELAEKDAFKNFVK
ncbi:hypothetical protein PsorP6_006062 [Peronosclerospora sorghi]|uniref:Uncharacterized protein n=1 Tax=Peronosclerospora sorghi TaxID=230839 RepID=A0ACC0W0M4_9STRA|nr:hypothetical protein PsorP6_006062 [Peronosclerospora sorghi]